MGVAFRLDLGLYHLSSVSQPVQMSVQGTALAAIYYLLIGSRLSSHADLQPSF